MRMSWRTCAGPTCRPGQVWGGVLSRVLDPAEPSGMVEAGMDRLGVKKGAHGGARGPSCSGRVVRRRRLDALGVLLVALQTMTPLGAQQLSSRGGWQRCVHD